MSHTGVVVRWMARFLSAIIALVVLIIFVGELVAAEDLRPPGFSASEFLMSAFYFIVWLGLLVGWIWEKLGGFMIISGLVLFYITQFISLDTPPSSWFVVYMMLPGLFYLLSFWLNREKTGESAAEEKGTGLRT